MECVAKLPQEADDRVAAGWSTGANVGPVKESSVRLIFGQGSIGRYAVIGVSGVILDTAVFSLLIHVAANPLLATVIGTSLGIMNNYVLNAHLNFKGEINYATGWRFATVGFLGVIASALLLHLALRMGFKPIQGKLFSIPLVVTGQFIGNKFWSFRPRDYAYPHFSSSGLEGNKK